MSAIEKATLSRAEARSLTDEVKLDAERLWRKLVELYEGDAHTTLGYGSWGAYFKAEFGGSKSRAYELLDAGKVLAAVRNSGLPAPANEAQANELKPLLKRPEKLREVWSGVVGSNPAPTAADVRVAVTAEVVPDFRPGTSIPAPKPAAIPRSISELRGLYEATRATPIEEVIDWRGNARQLAAQWASVQSYFTRAFAALEVPIPQVLEGDIVGN